MRCGGNHYPPAAGSPSPAERSPSFRASIAFTVFPSAPPKTRLPKIASTTPSARPLRFFPSRTTTTSTGRPVGLAREGVGVARVASPRVGVGGRHDHAIGIGPVVVQALPDAARALRDVGLSGAL